MEHLAAVGEDYGASMHRLYKDGYRDSLDAIDENGCVEVPQGPGLGVEYDWDYITGHSTGVTVYE